MERLLNKITLKAYVKGLRKFNPELKITDIYIRTKAMSLSQEK